MKSATSKPTHRVSLGARPVDSAAEDGSKGQRSLNRRQAQAGTLKMNARPELTPELLAAYRATEYRVQGDRPFCIRIGRASPEADRWLVEKGLETWGFITACNPFSRSLSDSENAERQLELRQELIRRGLPPISALGIDPHGAWPGEPSFWVMGISRRDLLELGTSFGQFAVVFGDRDAVAELLVCPLTP